MAVSANTEVSFNGLDLFGDTFEIQSVEGLADMPSLRSSDLVIAGRDGQRGGTDFLDTRTVTIEVAIYSFDDTSFYAAVAALRSAFLPSPTAERVLTFRLGGIADGSVCRVMCRPRGLSLPLEPTYWADYSAAIVQLVAADPLIYSDTLNSTSTTLPTAGGGMTFPMVFPLIFGDVAEGGAIFAVNAGTWPTDALMRIDGPAVNPRVENLTTGQVIEVDLTIADGDYLLLDTKQRTVLLNGTASRYSSLTDDSRWWQLVPGTNQITFRAVTDTAAEATLAWRSSWL